MIQPRLGIAWDVNSDGESVVRASAGVLARQNMLSQVGSVTTNGLQQQTIYMDTTIMRQFGAPTPVWPGVRPRRRWRPARSPSAASGCSTGITRIRASTP